MASTLASPKAGTKAVPPLKNLHIRTTTLENQKVSTSSLINKLASPTVLNSMSHRQSRRSYNLNSLPNSSSQIGSANANKNRVADMTDVVFARKSNERDATLHESKSSVVFHLDSKYAANGGAAGADSANNSLVEKHKSGSVAAGSQRQSIDYNACSKVILNHIYKILEKRQTDQSYS